MELDINLLCFESLLRKPAMNSDKVMPSSIINGESEIYNLINYDLIDGVIIEGESMIRESIIFDIAEKAARKGVPVVNVADPAHTLEHNVILSDKNAMEQVVRHLIKEHGSKRIDFIGGFPGNIQTEDRLAAYKRVLAENGIEFDPERVRYGEFWKKAADCTRELLRYDTPDAIVCANDTMAFFCMDVIKELGLRIPEDIIVTGFDSIADCEVYKPTLTSVRHSFAGSGRACVDLLSDIWAGREISEPVYIEPELVERQSCGCVPVNSDEKDFYNAQYASHSRTLEFFTNIVEMNTRFSGAETSAELYADCRKGAEFFKLKNLYICICSNIEHESLDISVNQLRAASEGISETMVSMFDLKGGVPVGTEFSSSQLVPTRILDGEKAAFYAFSPLYFKDSFLGYFAYEPSFVGGAGDYFAPWVLSISNNAGSFYLKNQLEIVVDKLENLYVRDPLTDLFNRRGMGQYGDSLMRTAMQKHKSVTVFSIDIDDLKTINDHFGHEEGDNAICRSASAISKAMPMGSICCRTGGDEFVVIVSGLKRGGEHIFTDLIENDLDEYNKHSGKAYAVSCSAGWATADGDSSLSMEELTRIADNNMYTIKNAKKAKRAAARGLDIKTGGN